MGISKRFVAKNGLDNNNQTITNVADPVNAQDVASKNFASNADNLSSGTVSSARLPSTLSVGDGTAATPSVAFTSDTDTGLYKPATNTIAISTAGTEKVRINNVGNVGIGITAPTVPLEVRKSATGSTVMQRIGITGQTKNPYLESKVDETNGVVTLNATGSYTPAFSFEVGASERMRINTNGNVVIENSLSSNIPHELVVSNQNTGSSASAVFRLSSNNGNLRAISNSTASGGGSVIYSDNTSGVFNINTFNAIPLTLGTNSNERMRIDPDGTVLHGTDTKPLYIGASSFVNATGNIVTFNKTGGVGSVIAYGGTAPDNAPYIRFRQDTNTSRIEASRAGTTSTYTPMTFYVSGSEAMRIDANGNVGIGESNPSGWNSKFVVRGSSGNVQSSVINNGTTSNDYSALAVIAGGMGSSLQQSGDGGSTLNLNGIAGKDRRIVFLSSNKPKWVLAANTDPETGSNAGSNFGLYRYSDNGSYLGGSVIYRNNGDFLHDGSIFPTTDGNKVLGTASNRWSVVYAATGAINTSDAREKTEVRSLTDAEINAAKQLAKEIGAYKFLASVAEKGDAAREHIGMTVQKAIEIMENNGLDPFNYGFICYDEWEQQTQTVPAVQGKEAVEGKEAVLDEEGNIIEPAIEAVAAIEEVPAYERVTVEAGNRYSFRTDELNLFIARGLAAQLESIEARLNALGA